MVIRPIAQESPDAPETVPQPDSKSLHVQMQRLPILVDKFPLIRHPREWVVSGVAPLAER
jgi:hypothetical protein